MKEDTEKKAYEIELETNEAARKVVEAQGIADAQKIINESLTPEYLQWYFITNMEKMTQSNNTTFMYVPYDQGLVPTPIMDMSGDLNPKSENNRGVA